MDGTEVNDNDDETLPATPFAGSRLDASGKTPNDNKWEVNNGGRDIDFDGVFDENTVNSKEPEANNVSVPDEHVANQEAFAQKAAPKADGMVGVAARKLAAAEASLRKQNSKISRLWEQVA